MLMMVTWFTADVLRKGHSVDNNFQSIEITKTDQFANTFAINRYSSENDAIYESAWNQLTNKYKDRSFKPSRQLMQRLGV